MKTGLLYGIVASSKTMVRCVFCGVHIPKPSKCIEQHTNGSKHKENIELMAENGISLDEDTLYCKPCHTALAETESVAKHIDNEDHANWMAAVEDLIDGEFIKFDEYLTSPVDKEDIYCEVCKSFLTCTLLSLEEHVNGSNHRANLADKLKLLNGIFTVSNEDEVWCKVCDLYIENTVQSILDHIDDEESHWVWFADIEDANVNQDVSIEEYLANEHYDKAFCNKCNLEILCDVQSIEEHILSETHLNSYN